MEKIKLGIIGVGNIGVTHSKNITSGQTKLVDLVAVCDIAPDRRTWAEKNLPGVKVFDDATEMMKSGLIDSVLIGVPHYDHPRLAIEAFSYGLNVYNEKPAGVYTKQVLEMNEAAKKSGKVFSMGFNQRTRPPFQKVRQLVQSGQLGHIKKVIWIATDWYRPQAYHDSCSWRSTWKGEGGGTIINQNPHNLDLFQWIFGMPSKILSMNDYGKYYNIEVEDDVSAFFKYDNGTVGIYTTSTGEAPGTNRLEISCDMGKIVCEFGKITFWRNVESEREFNKNFDGVFGTPECWKCEIPTKDEDRPQHAILLDNFADAILHGKELLAPGLEGINEMTISNAIYYSDWLGNKWVDVKNFDHDGFYNALQDKVAKSTVVKNVKQKTAGTEGSY
ncbi:MAG TPA: Gfo/Idh/MocA family oxidoreductase [Candidatus Aphodoplasma excrementigallinarum]|uniref:Gfo/Idh/MocA family oxidoreductase n=1 Tax=Candidatus Aphodoplasma excrementigallinarum TaxID=2840673 RepID=A0A9D1SZL5_9FIRM|nr:Gfo/Idh/MocA family oxidoreductase [Candidatus Aphodoplasma excrementigallinarum]